MELKINNLTKKYPEVEALKDVSFKSASGEFLVVLGPPGAGKTSLLKIIAGLEEVTEGEIYYGDQPFTEVEPQDRDASMAFEGYALYPHLTVYENIAHPLRIRESYEDEKVKHMVTEVTEMLRIDHLWERKTDQLSGGQKQRVALARALIREKPNVLLLDEPIAHLDASLRHWLRGELKRYVKAKGITTIYSTPDYQEALAMGDRILVLFEGRLKQIGTPENILYEPRCAEVAAFIGDPPTNIIEVSLVRSNGKAVLEFEGVHLQLDNEWAGKNNLENYTQLLLGIRPSDIRITKEKKGSGFDAVVYVAESMQRKQVVTLQVGSKLIKVNESNDLKIEIGDEVWAEVDVSNAMLFNAETKKIIGTNNG